MWHLVWTSSCPRRWWTLWSRTTGFLRLWTARPFFINWCSSAGWRSVTHVHASPTSLAHWTSCCAMPPASKHSPPHTQGKCVSVCVCELFQCLYSQSWLVRTLKLTALCNTILYLNCLWMSEVLGVYLLMSASDVRVGLGRFFSSLRIRLHDLLLRIV